MKSILAFPKQVQSKFLVLMSGNFDVSTEQGRSNERIRRIMLSAGGSLGARATAVICNLVLVPVLLNYLGLELFGVWAAISSFVVFLSFADLGIGNGVINNISHAFGKDDREAVRHSITNGYAILFLVSAMIIGAILLSNALGASLSPIKVSTPQYVHDSQTAFFWFLLIFAVNIPLSLIQKIQSGMQAGYYNNLWQFVSAIVGLGLVLMSVHLKFNLPTIIALYMLAMAVPNAVNTALFFIGNGRQYFPDVRMVDRQECFQLLKVGFMFFVMQISFAAAYNSDGILISNILGSKFVALYSVPERILSLPSIVLSMALIPLWPAYSEAFARGDNAWIRMTHRRSLLITIAISASSSLVLGLSMPFILQIWVHGKIALVWPLIIGLGIWKIFEALAYANNAYLNAAKLYKFQALTTLSFALLALPAKILFYKTFGIAGGIWALSLTYVICPGIPIFLKIRPLLFSRGNGDHVTTK